VKADRAMLQTEFEFTLPRGYIDRTGNLHRTGVMRLATALDEVEPLQDTRARANEAYLSILLLSRVLIRLGDLSPVTPAIIEGLFASDFSYLQELYVRLNDAGSHVVETQCPACGTRFGKFIMDLRAAALARIDRLYPDDPFRSGMMQAVLIGQSFQLQKVWTDQWRSTGTFHAIVISGTSFFASISGKSTSCTGSNGSIGRRCSRNSRS